MKMYSRNYNFMEDVQPGTNIERRICDIFNKFKSGVKGSLEKNRLEVIIIIMAEIHYVSV